MGFEPKLAEASMLLAPCMWYLTYLGLCPLHIIGIYVMVIVMGGLCFPKFICGIPNPKVAIYGDKAFKEVINLNKVTHETLTQ